MNNTVERLTTLRNFLATLKQEDLEMNSWSCGTTACALGWACQMPEFNEEGLCLVTLPEEWSKVPCYVNEFGDPTHNYSAAVCFFGINKDQTQYLFDPSEYWETSARDPILLEDVLSRFDEVIQDYQQKEDNV